MTFREYLNGLAPPLFRDGAGIRYAYRFLMITVALMFDLLKGAAREALAAGLMRPGQPSDAGVYLGSERVMPAYRGESWDSHRERLLGAWDAWPFAGTAQAIVGQLAAAGITAEIYTPRDWPLNPPGSWWSQFWVFLPEEGGHGYSAGTTYGSGAVYGGSTTLYGLTGDPYLLGIARAIIDQWKPGHVVCRGIYVEITGPSYGTGHTYGDGSLYGGESVLVGA